MDRTEIKSIDRVEGNAPVLVRVRLDPGKTCKIIAIPLSLAANILKEAVGGNFLAFLVTVVS